MVGLGGLCGLTEPVRVALEIRGGEADVVGEADLDEVEIPVVRLLVDVEQGRRARIVNIAGAGLPEQLQGLQVGFDFHSLGGAQGAYETALAYSKQRVAFGKKISAAAGEAVAVPEGSR